MKTILGLDEGHFGEEKCRRRPFLDSMKAILAKIISLKPILGLDEDRVYEDLVHKDNIDEENFVEDFSTKIHLDEDTFDEDNFDKDPCWTRRREFCRRLF